MSSFSWPNIGGSGGSGGAVVTTTLSQSIVTAIDANYQYYGYAPPGSSTSALVWQVFRVAIANPVSGGGTIPLLQYANGSSSYTNAANAMTGLSYS